jgi:predicted MFS family arabinose efflux permease
MIGIQGATIVPIVLGHFKESEQTLGLVNALGGTVALASVMISPSLLNRTSAYSLWLMSSLLGYLGFLETGFASSFKAYAIGLGIVEIACGIGIYSLRVMRASLIPFSDQGKTLGMIYFLQQLSLPLGGFIMGVFSEIEGLQSLIIQTTLLCGLLAVPLFLLGRAAKSVHSERAIS